MMRAAFLTSWSDDRRGRLAVCAILIPLLLLSSLSLDVFVTHAQDDDAAHTHAIRTLAGQHIRQHDDRHHHPPITPACEYERSEGTGHRETESESESIVVVSSAGKWNRQDRDAAKQLQDLVPVMAIIQPIELEPAALPDVHRISAPDRTPSSAYVKRSCVLLI